MKSLVPETIALQKIIRKLPLSDKSRIIYKVILKSIQCVQSLWQEKFVNRVEWDGNLLKTSWGRGEDVGKTVIKTRLSLFMGWNSWSVYYPLQANSYCVAIDKSKDAIDLTRDNAKKSVFIDLFCLANLHPNSIGENNWIWVFRTERMNCFVLSKLGISCS